MATDEECRKCPKRRAWRREWRRDLILFGALLVVLFGLGYATLVLLLDRVEVERSERVRASADLIAQVCRRDNAQDRALSELVRVSIRVSEDPAVDRVFTHVLGELASPGNCDEIARAYLEDLP